MKLKYSMACFLALFASVFRLGAREEIANAASTAGTHENGIVTMVAEEAVTTRYLLLKKGSAANGALINAAATTRPVAVALDEPASGDAVAAAILGVAKGTLRMIASGAMTAFDWVYSDASGKVSATAAAGSWLVGVALNTVAAEGDTVEVAHCVPRAVPAVANATADRTVTAQEAIDGIFVSNLGAAAAVAFALPAAIPGMRVSAVVRAAQELRLDPNGTETIALPSSGVQGAAGKYLTADAVGENVELICLTAGTWDAVGHTGTWTAQA